MRPGARASSLHPRGLVTMTDVEQLAGVVQELGEVLQLQARDLEQLIARMEQVTARVPEAGDLSVVRSQLAALHVRVKKLRAGRGTPGQEKLASERGRA